MHQQRQHHNKKIWVTCREGLPYRIKDEFAITAHDISTLVKMQTIALQMDQHLAWRSEERPRTEKFPKRGKKAAQCPARKGGQCAAASSSSSTTSDEVVALQLQLKALEERIATLTTMKEKEGF
ncbi:hypothetical protein K466DRAFT_607426 [Polyporus arcularius HHB13444]|uniref:Uncharacterized protein n=1 Tax=Polyporus arcularius HHB13444 TaxID=1314778 RepID=A0A5C3NWW2_9APHY|nr:hypothetical protein K466DRAFT_607426 [Polyporus arcularius HHB13444]